MAEITLDESGRQVRALVDRAEQAVKDRRWSEAVGRWEAVLNHPCAHHQVVDHEILDEVHQAWRQAGRYDEAIVAKREAIAAGYRSVPDPEADIATVVRTIFDELGLGDERIGKGNREDLTAPVLTLREAAQRLGLLRKYQGRLVPTSRARRLTGDPVGLWWHLASRLPLGGHNPAGASWQAACYSSL